MRTSTERNVLSEVASRLPPVPGVLLHGDVSCDHVIVDSAKGFTVVDWEWARRPGLPLWDVILFLTDALTLLDGSPRVEHVIRLFRGELPSSRVLFRWIRVAADALRIPHDAVGPITTLLWLETALRWAGRAASLKRHDPANRPEGWLFSGIGEQWLSDAALGTTWSRWRDG